MRNYVKKRVQLYSQNDKISAIADYKSKAKQIVEKYKIPMTTLMNNIETLRTTGRSTFFKEEIELELVEAIILLAHWGFGFDKNAVESVLMNYCAVNKAECDRLNFKGGYGYEWYCGFMSRRKALLSSRIGESFTASRIMACNQNIVNGYFDLLASV